MSDLLDFLENFDNLVTIQDVSASIAKAEKSLMTLEKNAKKTLTHNGKEYLLCDSILYSCKPACEPVEIAKNVRDVRLHDGALVISYFSRK